LRIFRIEEFKGKRVLEVRSKYIDGSVRPLIEKFASPEEYVGIDIELGKYVDIVLPAERLVLILDERVRRSIGGEIVDSKVEGRVTIEEGARVKDSVIRSPAIIGRNCLIKNSFIGPYTSVDEGSQIIDSNVEYCVILREAVIRDIDRLEESLIGRYAKIIKKEGRRRALRLNVGDYSEVYL